MVVPRYRPRLKKQKTLQLGGFFVVFDLRMISSPIQANVKLCILVQIEKPYLGASFSI